MKAATSEMEVHQCFRLTIIRERESAYEFAGNVNDPAQGARLIHRLLGFADREILGALLLDTRNVLIGHVLAYVGTLSRAAVEPRGVLVPALLANAAGVVVFHTHPSGDTRPSSEDIVFTRRLAEAAEVVGVRFLDHLILGEPPSYRSLRDERGSTITGDWGPSLVREGPSQEPELSYVLGALAEAFGAALGRVLIALDEDEALVPVIHKIYFAARGTLLAFGGERP